MIFQIIAILLSQPCAFAAETAAGSQPSVVERLASTHANYLQRECSRLYQENGCETFFKSNPEVAKYAVDCQNPVSPGKEIYACGAGAYDGAKDLVKFVAEAVAGVPGAFRAAFNNPDQAKQLAADDECAKSLDCKVSLWELAYQRTASAEWRQRLEKVNTGRLLRGIVHGGFRERQIQQGERLRQILHNEPDSPERDQKIEAIVPGWIERQNAQKINIWNVGLAAGEKLLKKAQCYNREVQMEAFCYGVASIAVPSAAAAAISRFPRLAQIVRATGATIPEATAAERLAHANAVLGTKIAEGTGKAGAIEDAHRFALGSAGRDGTPTRHFNFTKEQLEGKLKILEDAGFTPQEAKELIRRGVVGPAMTLDEATAAVQTFMSRANQIPQAEYMALQARMQKYGCDLAKYSQLSARCAWVFSDMRTAVERAARTPTVAANGSRPGSTAAAQELPEGAWGVRTSSIDKAATRELADLPAEAQDSLRDMIRRTESRQVLHRHETKPVPSVARGVHEFRITLDGEAYRVFYYFSGNNEIKLLGAYHKKTEQIPKSISNLIAGRMPVRH